MTVYIQDFMNWDGYPPTGKTAYQDSTIHDFDFEKDGIEYFVKSYIEIEYDRYFERADWETPGNDEFYITDLNVEIIKGYKYVKGDEVELTDRELRKIKKYIIEKIEII